MNHKIILSDESRVFKCLNYCEKSIYFFSDLSYKLEFFPIDLQLICKKVANQIKLHLYIFFFS